MGAGARVLDELAPDWRRLTEALGGVPFDASAGTALWDGSSWLPRFESGIEVYGCSRWLLESVLLQLIGDVDHISIRSDVEVRGLIKGADQEVVGVTVAAADGGVDTVVRCELVVDASGRGSRLPRWLRTSYPERVDSVAETTVQSGRDYVSRWYHLPAHEAPDWSYLFVASTPGEPHRSGMMVRGENDKWGVVFLSAHRRKLPNDDKGFMRFARSLSNEELGSVLERATPLSDIHRYGHTSSRLRHFERIRAWPEGLVALGDSVCALDPYFGLGMTQSALSARLLRDRALALTRPRPLEDDSSSPAATRSWAFQAELAVLNASTWGFVTAGTEKGGEGPTPNATPSSRQDDAWARSVVLRQHMLDPRSTTATSAP